jgi:pimeloyl-ACP methyl ester carboxylesterase
MRLHFTEMGQGRPVCLLHGLFGRSQNLAQLARRLAPQARVLSMDLRNHGASPVAAGMDLAALAEDVLQTLAGAGASQAMLLGHSLGGKVAMMAALTWPGAIDRLVVADIAPVAYRHGNAGIAAALQALALPAGLTRRAADAALAAAVPDPGVRAFLLQNLELGETPRWKIGLDQIAAAIPAIEGWPDLPPGLRYPGPTLFIAGGASDYVRPADLAAITALFPAARVETIANAGHWLHAEQPEAFGARVERFFMHADATKAG